MFWCFNCNFVVVVVVSFNCTSTHYQNVPSSIQTVSVELNQCILWLSFSFIRSLVGCLIFAHSLALSPSLWLCGSLSLSAAVSVVFAFLSFSLTLHIMHEENKMKKKYIQTKHYCGALSHILTNSSSSSNSDGGGGGHSRAAAATTTPLPPSNVHEHRQHQNIPLVRL